MLIVEKIKARHLGLVVAVTSLLLGGCETRTAVEKSDLKEYRGETSGYQVTVTVTNSDGREWRQLQRYHSYVNELKTVEGSIIGCRTNKLEPVGTIKNEESIGDPDDGITCEELLKAKCVEKWWDGRQCKEEVNGGDDEVLAQVNTLVYGVLGTEYETVRSVFEAAKNRANKETSDLAFGGEGGLPVIEVNVTGLIEFPLPACIPPYKSPCYVRPNCIATGGCSRTSAGCSQCTY
jgi:hypothetical protein